MDSLEAAASKIRQWRNDPVSFVREEFGIEPDEWQKDFLIAFNNEQRIAAKACKGPGKTAVLAWCAWLFMATRFHPKVVATSISGENLRDGLWAEMAKWQMKSEFLTAAFTWRAERIVCNDHPETWWMAARRWKQDAQKEQQANTLAGLHADYMLFIIDEAGGVPDAVMAAAEAALSTGIECKLLICGNPTHLSGPLYRACTTEASLWHVIEITGDPDDEKRSPRISMQWAREQIQKYGRDHAYVLVNVFGQFPPASFNALLGPDDVTAAMQRQVPRDAYMWAAKVLGVDVARQGDDSTVLAPRQGLVAFRPKVYRIDDTQQLAGVIAQHIRTWGPDAVNVDATGGMGYGVIDALRSWGYAVNEVQYAGKAGNAVYFNKRTEMALEFANWVKGGGCLPDDPQLREECCAMEYTHKKDKMQLFEKDIVKEKIGRSPDKFDAYAQTFAFPVLPQSHAANKPMAADYNPLAMPIPEPQAPHVDEYNPLGYD